MSEGSSGPRRPWWDPDPAERPRPDDPPAPSPYAPTEVPPTEVARPYPSPYAPTEVPPTEVARPYRPAHAASPYVPTDVAPPYVPTDVAPPYEPPDVTPPYGPTRADFSYPPTEMAPSHGPTYDIPPYPPTEGSGRPQDLVRYGPGVPAAPPEGYAETAAERVWRTGRPDKPPRRPARLRRLLGSVLTVALLAASGVLLYLRFHHAPFHVTGAAITQRTPTSCGMNVTGRIDTNGAAGTVSYQWLFRPDPHPPQPLNQSVTAGQHAVYVTVAVQGTGHGSASQTVTLQVLGPDRAAASATVAVSCR